MSEFSFCVLSGKDDSFLLKEHCESGGEAKKNFFFPFFFLPPNWKGDLVVSVFGEVSVGAGCGSSGAE